jgi:glycosyltransferase involved in cell wall biosynthesis
MSPLRILFVTPYVPSLLRRRPYQLMQGLKAAGHRVTLLTAYTSEAERADAKVLRDTSERVVAVRVPRMQSLWNCARALVGSALPLQAVYICSPTFTRAVQRTLREAREAGQPYDLLHVEHLRAALTGLSVGGIPRVYDAVDCMTHLLDQTRRWSDHRPSRLLARLDAARTRRFEAQLGRHFDRILVTSAIERQALVALAPDAADNITVVPNGVDLEYFRPAIGPRDPATLVFVGRMGYHANIDAVARVIHHVLPVIWERRPDVSFTVVGPDPPSRLLRAARRAAGRIRFEGYVPDVRPLLGRATATVAPFAYAVGMQNKVLEAMAMGTPVVTTPVGAAALDVRDGEHLLVAADAASIARQILRLLDDTALRERIAAGGRRYVAATHDWAAIVRSVIELYEHSVTEDGRRSRPIPEVPC